LTVLGIVDPVLSRAQSVLEEKKEVSGYQKTTIWRSIEEYQGESPDAVFLGTPPAFRGTMTEGKNIEVASSMKFPSAALFVEKPISSALPEDVAPLITYFEERGTFVAVGYMLRYLKGRAIPRNVDNSHPEDERHCKGK
jgi:predicted dehydrogenase